MKTVDEEREIERMGEFMHEWCQESRRLVACQMTGRKIKNTIAFWLAVRCHATLHPPTRFQTISIARTHITN